MLTKLQRERTSAELHSHLAACGLPLDQVAADLHLSSAELQVTLRVAEGCDAVHVWLLRDYLAQAVDDADRQLPAFSVLTEDLRPRCS